MKSFILSISLALSAVQAVVASPEAMQAVEQRDGQIQARAVTFVVECAPYKGSKNKMRKGAGGKEHNFLPVLGVNEY